MLRFGFFEDFKGSDTLLIWGDTTGLSHFQKLLLDLGSKKDGRASLQWAGSPQSLTVDFETSVTTSSALQTKREGDRVAIFARCSAAQFAKFAQKVAVLTDPACKTGHQFLNGFGSPDVQVVVSKGEHPSGFGSGN